MNPQEWSQDQSDSMFFGHIFSKKGSDAYLRKIGSGDKDAMVKAYEIFHHTDPNAQPGTNQRAINAFQ